MAAVFDTLAATRHMQNAGMDRQHAEAVAEIAREAAAADREDLAAKADLKAEITRLESRHTWRMVVVMGAFSGLLFAAFKLVP